MYKGKKVPKIQNENLFSHSLILLLKGNYDSGYRESL